jgi:hypothetical protein
LDWVNSAKRKCTVNDTGRRVHDGRLKTLPRAPRALIDYFLYCFSYLSFRVRASFKIWSPGRPAAVTFFT